MLGNDIEDDQEDFLKIEEVVKKKVISKKDDLPPQKSKVIATTKPPLKTKSDLTLKTKIDNKSFPPPPNTSNKNQKKLYDRHSRTAAGNYKRKSKLLLWIDEDSRLKSLEKSFLDGDTQNDSDLSKNIVEEKPKQLLLDYFNQLMLKQNELNTTHHENLSVKAETSFFSEKVSKTEEENAKNTFSKKNRSKSSKSKKFLEINASFFDPISTIAYKSSKFNRNHEAIEKP